jgi:hypothetical protein
MYYKIIYSIVSVLFTTHINLEKFTITLQTGISNYKILFMAALCRAQGTITPNTFLRFQKKFYNFFGAYTWQSIICLDFIKNNNIYIYVLNLILFFFTEYPFIF